MTYAFWAENCALFCCASNYFGCTSSLDIFCVQVVKWVRNWVCKQFNRHVSRCDFWDAAEYCLKKKKKAKAARVSERCRRSPGSSPPPPPPIDGSDRLASACWLMMSGRFVAGSSAFISSDGGRSASRLSLATSARNIRRFSRWKTIGEVFEGRFLNPLMSREGAKNPPI